MSQQAHVQIEFEFTCPAAEYRHLVDHVAPAIAGVPGLVSKLWIIDEDRRRAGGAYLFTDRNAARAYLEGRIIAQLEKNPALTGVNVRLFDVLTDPSVVTRGITQK